MASDLTLSEMVKTYIEELDWEGRGDLSAEARQEREKDERVLKLITKNI